MFWDFPVIAFELSLIFWDLGRRSVRPLRERATYSVSRVLVEFVDRQNFLCFRWAACRFAIVLCDIFKRNLQIVLLGRAELAILSPSFFLTAGRSTKFLRSPCVFGVILLYGMTKWFGSLRTTPASVRYSITISSSLKYFRADTSGGKFHATFKVLGSETFVVPVFLSFTPDTGTRQPATTGTRGKGRAHGSEGTKELR